MTPETHTRHRVQRLIRLGEWLERNQAAMLLAADVISEAHDMLIDPPEDMPCSDIVELTGAQQMQAVMALNKLMQELRFNVPTRNVNRGGDVTLHHPYAFGSNEYQVVMEAPQPQDIPSQEEFDRVRAQVDITN